MTTVQRLTCATLALVLAAAAGAQEQTDPYAELGLIEDTVPVAEDDAAVDGTAADADDTPQVLTEEDVLREHARFLRYHEEDELLPPELPGRALAVLALMAPRDWSGEFIQWDEARVQDLVRQHGVWNE